MMITTGNDVHALVEKSEEHLAQALDKLYAAAQPGAVFSEPVRVGNVTVITASEVSVGGGLGSGKGFGPGMMRAQKQSGEQERPQGRQSGGGGMGGGGGSMGRPVAVIVIGPDDVKVQPIMDLTKIVLAGITTWGTMFLLLKKMRPAGRR